MYQSVVQSNSSEHNLYDLLKSYTLVLERQIPVHDLNQNFYIRVHSKLRNLLVRIFEQGQPEYEEPSSIYIRYLQKGFNYKKIQSYFFEYFGKIEREMAVPNYEALLTVQELIDNYISKIQNETGACTLVDVQNFLYASLLIYSQLCRDPIADLIGDA